jgi:serine/threonine-protein kinase/endoribonuclease IRE1
MQSGDSQIHGGDNTVQNGFIHVGNNIFYNENKILHKSNNAIIYEGYYEIETRKAAVKRLTTNNSRLYYNEIELLRALDYRYTIKYFATISRDSYYYIATELAKESLEAYIKNNKNQSCDKLVKLIKESCLGLKCLHDQNILHRDIKPSNILISLADERAMIADFGISKFEDISGTGSTIKGTEDWLAPEVLKANQDGKGTLNMTKECDIFSMGCTSYYAITQGEHPYGEMYRRTGNIIDDKVDWIPLDSLNSDSKFSYLNLIKAMLSADNTKRPQITAVIMHPTFWDPNKKLQFLKDVSNRLKVENSVSKNEIDFNNNLIKELNNYINRISDAGDWTQQFNDPESSSIKQYLTSGRRKKYDGKSVMKLIEFIRDKDTHWNDLPEDVKNEFGKTDQTYMDYFEKRFPHLLVITYVVLQKLKNEPRKTNSYYVNSLSNGKFELK